MTSAPKAPAEANDPARTPPALLEMAERIRASLKRWLMARARGKSLLIVGSEDDWLRQLRDQNIRAFQLDLDGVGNKPDPLKRFRWQGDLEAPLPQRFDFLLVTATLPAIETTEAAIANLASCAGEIILLPESRIDDPLAWTTNLARHGFLRDIDFGLLIGWPRFAGRFRRSNVVPEEVVRRYESRFPLYLESADALIQRSRHAAAQGHWLECEAAARQVLAKDCDHLQALTLLAVACHTLGRTQDAAEAISYLLRAPDGLPTADLASLLPVIAGQRESAQMVSILLDRQDLSLGQALQCVDSMRSAGDHNSALACLADMSQRWPESDVPPRVSSEILEEGENWEECLIASELLLDLAPTDFIARRRAILCAFHCGKRDALQRHMHHLFDTSDIKELRWLAEACETFWPGRPETAAVYERILWLDDNDIDAYSRLVGYFLNRQQLEQALPWIELWASVADAPPVVLILLGECRMSLGMREDAEQALVDALADQPTHHEALARLMALAAQLGRQDLTVDIARRRLTSHPTDPRVRFQCAAAIEEAGEFLGPAQVIEEAAVAGQVRGDYLRSIRLNPGSYAEWEPIQRETSVNLAATLMERVNALATRPRIGVIVDDRDHASGLKATLDSLEQQLLAADQVVSIGDRDGTPEPPWDLATALGRLETDYVIILRSGDRLESVAVASLALDAARCGDEPMVVTFDHDHSNIYGHRGDPSFKPRTNLAWLLRADYIGRAAMLRRDALRKVLGDAEYDAGREGAEGLARALLLRASATSQGVPTSHLPAVLACMVPGKMASSDLIPDARRYLDSTASHGDILACTNGLRIRPPAARVKVSVVIPTRDRPLLLSRCLDSLLRLTGYAGPLEVVIVNNDSTQPEAIAVLKQAEEHPAVKVCGCPNPFNFSELCNVGARAAKGEVLVFLNDDTVIRDGSWLDELVGLALSAGVGAVGPLLRYPDGTIQHGGVVLCPDGQPRLAHQRTAAGTPLALGRTDITHEVSALAAACLVMQREVFDQLDGFDEAYAVTYGDIDLSLRLRLSGYRLLWTPHVSIDHYEGVSARFLDAELNPDKADQRRRELQLFRSRWHFAAQDDPYYSPNLDAKGQFVLAGEPRWRLADFADASRPARRLLVFGEPGGLSASVVEHIAQTAVPAGAGRTDIGGWCLKPPQLVLNVTLTGDGDPPFLPAENDSRMVILRHPRERLIAWTLTVAGQLELTIPEPEPGKFGPLFAAVIAQTHGDPDAFWQDRASRFGYLLSFLDRYDVTTLAAEDLSDAREQAFRTLQIASGNLGLQPIPPAPTLWSSWMLSRGKLELDQRLASEIALYESLRPSFDV